MWLFFSRTMSLPCLCSIQSSSNAGYCWLQWWCSGRWRWTGNAEHFSQRSAGHCSTHRT